MTAPARPAIATRGVLAVLLALHGYAHFVGTADNLRRLDEHTAGRLLGSTITSPALLGTLALLWAALGIGFVVTGVLVGFGNPRARLMATALAAASLTLCVVSLWATWIGVLINVAILAALELAVRAPSIHNTPTLALPHRRRQHLHLYADPARRLPTTDPDERDLMISCGAALHHLRTALAALGYLPVTDYLPDPTNPNHLATIETIPRPATHDALTLAESIPRRHSDRRPYQPEPLNPAILDELTRHAAAHATQLSLVHSGPARTTLVSAIAEADALQRANPRYSYELARWTGCRTTPDGIPHTNAPTTTRIGDLPSANSPLLASTPRPAPPPTAPAPSSSSPPAPSPNPSKSPPSAPSSTSQPLSQMIIRIGTPPPQPDLFPPTRRRPHLPHPHEMTAMCSGKPQHAGKVSVRWS